MREERRLARARALLRSAVYWSEAGRHPWAINEATEAVKLLRPAAAEHPAAMARALATRASCLAVRGREAEAGRDADECLGHAEAAFAAGPREDLAHAAYELDRAGRADDAFAAVDRLLADARGSSPALLIVPLAVQGQLLLRHHRPEEAVSALREAAALARSGMLWWVRVQALLFEALAGAGRLEELRIVAERELPTMAGVARFGGFGRRMYVRMLTVVQAAGVEPAGVAVEAELARHRRKLRRVAARRVAVSSAVARVSGRRADDDEPRPPDRPGRVYRHSGEREAEAEVERVREAGDDRARTEAWGRLAQLRWDNGGQRSAALSAEREALAAARRWAAVSPTEARDALQLHLRRFADFAAVIGLRSDADAARAEAAELNR